MKTCLLRSCVLALSLNCGISGTKAADCYWLRLNGLSVAKSSDFFCPG